MRKLPNGWRWVKLGDVCELYQPETISMQQMCAEPGPYPVFGANGIIGTFGRYNHEDSEVLVTCRGATCGSINFSQPRCWITGNAMVAKLRNSGELDKQFLFWILNGVDLSDAIAGAAQPQITRQSLSPIQIPLPPLPDQQRIAAILKEQMAAVDKARAAAEARLEAVKTLPAAFLRQVFPQPGQPLPEGWRWAKLGEVCEIIAGQSPPGSTYRTIPDGLPFFQGKVDFGKINPVARVWCVEPAKIAQPGDILISVRAPVGPTNVANVECCIGRGLATIRCGMKSNPDFILNALRHFEATLVKKGSGSTFQAINRDDLVSFEIPLPPLTEQKQIAGILREQMATVEEARTVAEKELNTINALPAALLRRAFNGEL